MTLMTLAQVGVQQASVVAAQVIITGWVVEVVSGVFCHDTARLSGQAELDTMPITLAFLVHTCTQVCFM